MMQYRVTFFPSNQETARYTTEDKAASIDRYLREEKAKTHPILEERECAPWHIIRNSVRSVGDENL